MSKKKDEIFWKKMNSLKNNEGVLLLKVEGINGVPFLNFEEGTGVPLLNFSGVPGSTFKLWGGSRVPGPTFTPRHIFH